VSTRPDKILALQFKYLGDTVFLTPALRALAATGAELHVLVPAEAAALLAHLPWIKKVWALPRTRGRARLQDSWPLIRALRREGFGRSVDFGGNDRGAILSRVCGAKVRLASVDREKLLYRLCYTQRVATASLPVSWVQRHRQLLSAWAVPLTGPAHLEIAADPALAAEAAQWLPAGRVLCHLGTSQPRKEWPVARWQEFYRRAQAAGLATVFATGPGSREQAALRDLQKLEPGIAVLPPMPSLRLYLAVLRRARAVVAGDTGPLHFAAGLGVPVVGLFATGDSLLKSAPVYEARQVVRGSVCHCDGRQTHSPVCGDGQPCVLGIRTEAVFAALTAALAAE